MLTGRQIRQARQLLGLNRSRLARKVGRISTLAIARAEEAGDEPTLNPEQAAAVRQTLERLGIEFTDEPPGIRLRARPTTPASQR